jgi:hypothetical protein
MKSFHLQYDNEGVLLNKFEQLTMCDEDFRGFLRRMEAKGLANIDDHSQEPKFSRHLRVFKLTNIIG